MSCANLKDKFNLKRLPSSEDVQTLMDIKKQYDTPTAATVECTHDAKTAGEC